MEKAKHPWQARLVVGAAMIFLAFIGMVVTDVRTSGGWEYWKWVVPVYAVLALWLSWYMRRERAIDSPITLFHELLHWIGVIAAVVLVSYLVKSGIASRFQAGIFNLTVLSLGVFLGGVYIEPTFLVIGLLLGAFALVSAMVVQYLYAFILPLFFAAFGILALIIWFSHQKKTK
jgi:hypothetical protein